MDSVAMKCVVLQRVTKIIRQNSSNAFKFHKKIVFKSIRLFLTI